MALKDIKSVLAKKKSAGTGLGNTNSLTPSPAIGGASVPPTPTMDMGNGTVPPMDTTGSGMANAQDPQTMMEEGKQKVLEGLAEIKEAQAQMGGENNV
jgi:hypothetical protein